MSTCRLIAPPYDGRENGFSLRTRSPIPPSTVSVGNGFSCGLYSGSVQCWGTGPLGDGTHYRESRGPVTRLESGATSVAAGLLSACALTTGGGVRCWGDNRSGGLSDGTTTDRDVPVDVVGLGSGVVQIDAGGYQACAITTAGAVKCWGNGSPTPTTVPTLGSGMASVALGFQSACAVSTAGAAYCWGRNNSGQLGDGTTTDHLAPIAVPGLGSGVRAISLAENDEAIHFTLSNPVGAPLSTNLFGAQGIIRDDEPTPTVVPGVASLVESDSGTQVIHVPITLSGPSAAEITVPWSTLHVIGAPAGQSDPDSDYVATSGTVTPAPGQTTGWADITILGDTQVEPDEYIVVSFDHPTNAAMGGYWGLGFAGVQNDD